MCRKSDIRRCPSHRDPKAIAERNERRRQSYQFKKQLSTISKQFPNHTTPKPCSINLTNTNSKTFIQHLTEEQKVALMEYSEMEHYDTNRYLTDPKFKEQMDVLDPEVCPHWLKKKPVEEQTRIRTNSLNNLKKRITLMDEAIAANTNKEQQIVYRGQRNITPKEGETNEEAVMRMFPIGSMHSNAGYASTSANPSVAQSFSYEGPDTNVPVVLEIITSEGAPIRAVAAVSNEDEIILPRNKKFRVVGILPNTQIEFCELYDSDKIIPTGKYDNQIVVQLMEI